jgi:transcription termination factor NusB
MDHVEQEIHQVLSNHHQPEPLLLNEVSEQDEGFVIHQTKKYLSKLKINRLNNLLDIVLQLFVRHHIFSNIDKVMFVDELHF